MNNFLAHMMSNQENRHSKSGVLKWLQMTTYILLTILLFIDAPKLRKKKKKKKNQLQASHQRETIHKKKKKI